MSWQATAWAVRQTTGSPATKLTLLTLANYADESGACWPSQERLAIETEQSVDTVQRHIRKLVAAGLLTKMIRPQGRGRWTGRTYFLNMHVAEMSKPQSAARSEQELEAGPIGGPNRSLAAPTVPHLARDHAATSPVSMPQPGRPPCRIAVRPEPIPEPIPEPSLESSSANEPQKPKPSAVERQKAFRESRNGVEIIQNRIARRLGFDGWEILQSLNADDLHRVTSLEERGLLDVTAIELLRLQNTHREPAA